MKRFVKIGGAVLSMALILGIGCTVYNVYAKTSWTESQIEAEYEILSEFTVPEREVIVNGKQVKAKAVVQMPDGTATKEDTVKLKTAGMYTVTYTAENEGKRYVQEETFLVHNKLYSFQSEGSSATWGKYKHAKDTEGLMIRLAQGDTFTLNQPVDMKALQDGEWLIQSFVTPDSVGYADFNRLCFQFTDVNDPSVTLYISARQTTQDATLPYTYCVAGGDGQTPKGFEKGSGRLYEEGKYGSVTWHGFGLGNELCSEYCDEQSLNIGVDLSTMVVYSKEGTIIDLDSPEYFDTAWGGFPSGEAYLTIWADLYSAKTANFCLYKVGNVNLKQDKIVDAEPPVITINTEYDVAPQAVKGGCYQYIPTATAKDSTSGECEVTTKVYYNYQSPDANVLDAKDGTFETERIGYYAIVYEATDQFGNLGREIIWVKAEKAGTIKTPTITLKEKPATKWVVGEKFVPAEYTYECYSGNPIVNVYATKGKKTYNLNDGYRLEEEGTYTITYELKDCAGQIATYEYELVAKIGDRPVIGQDISMPKYMITGTEYTFPKVYFNDYRSGEKERKVAIGKIVDAKGERKVKAGDTYELEVENTGDLVSIIFECENGSYKVQVPTVKAWGKDNGRSTILLENYFVGSGFAWTKDEGITFKATSADGGWCFANSLLADNFALSLQGIQGSTDYESLVLTITDSVNLEEALTVELPYTPDSLGVKVGERTQNIKKGIDLATAGPISVEYTDGALYVAGAKIKNVDFAGFTSGKVYFSAHFKGAGNNAAFTLLSLQNHAMSASKTDKFGPSIVIQGDHGGTCLYGEEISIPTAVAGDVLNPNIAFSMSVICDGKVVKDIDGKELKDINPTKKYTIKADDFGKYNFVFTAYDSFNEKEETMTYVVHVVDDIEPVIKLKGNATKKAKIGDTICIPKFEVSDNLTKKEAIEILKYVQDPNGVLIPLLGNSNSVVASKSGEYKFVIMAIDEQSNASSESWVVTVTEK
ncbi:MAG: hypothetical protein IJE23_02885 [Tyzzerella sp.]|nr:hypothetical protein [Tyzzerella sp.]